MRTREPSRAAALLLVALWIFPLSCATTRDAPQWSDTYESRLELLALLHTVNAEVLASSSATATLERWCREHEMAAQPTIVVQRVEDVEKAPSAEQLQRLRVTDASAVKYRRVRLQCGAHTFSEADNWYVPARLTTQMNHLLETSDIPFGKVVRDLMPYRRTLEAKLLWAPLPPQWELRRARRSASRTPLMIPNEVLVHTAVLYTAEHEPFSIVVETYQNELFAFPRR
jgi:chorismate-pyruvate lyase